MEVKEQNIEELKFDTHNYNQHTEKGMKLLEKSITENGLGRSILVDKDGNIIAGNATAETAKKLGKNKIKVIETTGDELVVVKRTDLDIDSTEGRNLALADNAVSAINLKWNEGELRKAQETWGVIPEKWDIDLNKEIKESAQNYTRKIEVPLYEPKMPYPPELKSLYDAEKAEKLIKAIEGAKIPKDVKKFLTLAAYRHVIFDYEKIAEYYAHAEKEIQELFEKSALVIIDLENAIGGGYVRYCKEIIDNYTEDYDD